MIPVMRSEVPGFYSIQRSAEEHSRALGEELRCREGLSEGTPAVPSAGAKPREGRHSLSQWQKDQPGQ